MVLLTYQNYPDTNGCLEQAEEWNSPCASHEGRPLLVTPTTGLQQGELPILHVMFAMTLDWLNHYLTCRRRMGEP